MYAIAPPNFINSLCAAIPVILLEQAILTKHFPSFNVKSLPSPLTLDLLAIDYLFLGWCPQI